MASLLEFLIFGSFVWTVIVFAILLILLIFSESLENGFIGFIGVLAFLAINHYWGNIPVTNLLTWRNAFGYLGIGIVFAVIRVYFYGVERASKGYNLENELKNHVFRWWLNWPFSLIHWIFNGLLRDLFDVIYDKIEGFFKYFFELGFNSKNKSKKNHSV